MIYNTNKMTFAQYLYFIVLIIALVIYKKLYKSCQILIDRNNNLHYYHDNRNYLDEYILQNYNIHDYDSNIGYDLEKDNDIVSISFK
uniref:Uncharacterized protein n=1 Tax=viral metagenome TaxID=1070528 RepID=A0A6C0I0E8_9ZZZZ